MARHENRVNEYNTCIKFINVCVTFFLFLFIFYPTLCGVVLCCGPWTRYKGLTSRKQRSCWQMFKDECVRRPVRTSVRCVSRLRRLISRTIASDYLRSALLSFATPGPPKKAASKAQHEHELELPCALDGHYPANKNEETFK